MDLWALLVVAVLLLAVGDVLLWMLLEAMHEMQRALWAVQGEVVELSRWATEEPELGLGPDEPDERLIRQG